MQTASIEFLNGRLVIVPATWERYYDRPEEYRYTWPTGIPARPDDTRIGITGSLDAGAFWYDFGTHCIQLPEGGDTKPIRLETQPVKMPRRNKAYTWVWRYGAWARHYP